MNFKTYSFADLKALKNELSLRLNDPLQAVKFDEYRDMLTHTNKEINKRLDALISPVKETKQQKMSDHLKKTFLDVFNYETGHALRGFDDKAQRQLEKLVYINGYHVDNFRKAIKSAFSDMTLRETVKYLTPEFITRPAQFSKYLNMKDVEQKPHFVQA